MSKEWGSSAPACIYCSYRYNVTSCLKLLPLLSPCYCDRNPPTLSPNQSFLPSFALVRCFVPAIWKITESANTSFGEREIIEHRKWVSHLGSTRGIRSVCLWNRRLHSKGENVQAYWPCKDCWMEGTARQPCCIWFVHEADLSQSHRRDLPAPKSHLWHVCGVKGSVRRRRPVWFCFVFTYAAYKSANVN